MGSALGIRRKTLEEGIVIVKGNGHITTESIDAWAAVMINTIKEWPGKGPICIVTDHSGMREGFTAYARARVDDVLAAVPPGREAFIVGIVPDNIINHLVRAFLATRLLNGARVRVVHNEAEAMDWLYRMQAWAQDRRGV